MKITLIGAATVLGLLAAARAEAGPILYTTTDLGTNDRFLTRAGGGYYGVTGLNGVAYAFDKSPVTSLSEVADGPFGSILRLTLQNGTHQAGYYINDVSAAPLGLYPTFKSSNSTWFLQYGHLPGTPVSDINSSGQIVGTSQYVSGQTSTFAAFTDPSGQSHGFFSATVDNLNNYIAAIPGATLTSAVRVDDLGRIIAQGSDGHGYLLTPAGLGAPATVPEPPAGLLLGVVGALVGLRSARRRRRLPAEAKLAPRSTEPRRSPAPGPPASATSPGR